MVNKTKRKKYIICIAFVALIIFVFTVLGLGKRFSSKEVISKYGDTLQIGTTYVPEECIYMHILSSSFGSSISKCNVQDKYFQIIYQNQEQAKITVKNWCWQEFPYTAEEWADLFYLKDPIHVLSLYEEVLYQPLDKKHFLLQVDGELWLVDILTTVENTSAQIGSIYSLVTKESKGQLELEPEQLSFTFDMDYTSISVTASAGQLLNCEIQELEGGESASIYPKGSSLVWSPIDKNGNEAGGTNIQFIVNRESNTVCTGMIQLVQSTDSNGKIVYTASVIGDDLLLAQNNDGKGGVITYMDESPSVQFTYIDLIEQEFWFCSGAGGWRTVMYVNADGSFYGNYRDGDAGQLYLCDFTGQFSEPVKVNDYIWSAKIESIEQAKATGERETIEGIQYIYSAPYGLESAEEILFITPGAQTSELSEEFMSWVNGPRWGDNRVEDRMNCYGIYNVTEKLGFSSFPKDYFKQEAEE